MVGILTVSAVMAAPPRAIGRLDGVPVPGASWATLAATSEAELLEVEAQAAVAATNRPIVLLETNYYTFLPGDRLQLRLTSNPNGYDQPVTLYLYWQNRSTGEKRYYNIAGGGLLPAGQMADLFGASGSPVAINVPQLTDFVLLGSAADPAALSWGLDGALGVSITVPTGETGLYQYVAEIRDGLGKRVISRSNAMYSYITSQVNVAGQITANTSWTNDKRYVLSQFVTVENNATLTIQPGTVVYGGDSRATLFITRGAKIMADGTAMRPIIMTSPQRVGARAQRNWGSLVLLGRAPINEPTGEAGLEGLPNEPRYRFGGTDPNDSSGTVRYVRLEFGGFEIEVNQEINGLTLGGVGAGTVIDYLQVHFNKDDAIEFFGGTANAKHLLFTGIADDAVDGDLGWIGKVQYVVSFKSNLNDEGDGNLAFEQDNHPQNFSLTPTNNPQVYNVTAVGTGSTSVGAYGGNLRRGTAGKYYNVIIQGSRQAPLTIRDDATFNQAAGGGLVFDSGILFGDFSDAKFPNSADRGVQTRQFLFETMKFNRNIDPKLAVGSWSALDFLMPDVTPLPDSPALDVGYVKSPPDDGFFDQVDFIGGVGPNYNWTMTGWAVFSDN
jgi:hypothetical protein